MESSLAQSYVPMLGVRQALYAPRAAYHAVVVHTTGAGPVVRMTSERYAKWRRTHNIRSCEEAALWIYKYAHNAGGHYLVGQDGSVVQTAPENLAVWQVGSRGARLYSRQTWKRNPSMGWWLERWPELDSPRDLAGGHLWSPYPMDVDVHPRTRRLARFGSANANSVGIEVVPPVSGAKHQWSPQAWSALASLVADICSRRAIPIDKYHVVTHSDAHPLSRTTRSGIPWDPGPTQWSFDHFREVLEHRT